MKASSPIVLFVAIPCLDGNVSHQFCTSLVKTVALLKDHNIDHSITYAVGDSFISRARNQLTKDFLESNATHMLQIDSDQGWEPDAVLRMLDTGKDFVCGAVPIKDPSGENYALGVHTNWNRTPVVEDGMIVADMVGTAFMLTSRKVFETIECMGMVKHHHACGWAGYFDTEYDADGRFVGEDAAFCRKWRECDGRIYILPDIDFVHSGRKDFYGNYHRYMIGQPQPELKEFVTA